MPLRDEARNKWPGVLATLGIDRKALTGKHCPCPICGGRDRFRFDNLDGYGTWICSNCGAGDGPKLLELKHGWPFTEIAKKVREVAGSAPEVKSRAKLDPAKCMQLCRDLWGSSVPVGGTMAETYLLSRGFVAPYPRCLRFASEVAYNGKRWPALVALVTGADGQNVSLHRTFLSEGRKAPIEEPRALMPGAIPDGSAIRLAPLGSDGRLGIAEGTETANAARMLHGLPVWAAINSTMLKKFALPVGVRELHIFGDNDRKFGGQAAAYALAHRIACRDDAPEVHIHIPQAIGSDWDDVRAANSQAAA